MLTLLLGVLALNPPLTDRLDVLIFPVVSADPRLEGALPPLTEALENRVSRVPKVRGYRVREENVAVLDELAHSAMACREAGCAAELAGDALMHEAIVGRLEAAGELMRLHLIRLEARTAREMAHSQRDHRWQRHEELLADMDAMVRELFPEPVHQVPWLEPVDPAGDTLPERPDATAEPRGRPSWLLPPAVGAGISMGLMAALGVVPFLVSTVGLWLGSIYLLNLLEAALAGHRSEDVGHRVMLQGTAVTALMWPAVVAAPMAVAAPLIALISSAAGWWIPKWLWARRPLPAWTSVGPSLLLGLLCSSLLLVPITAGLFATGAYLAPWGSLQQPRFVKREWDVIGLAFLTVALGAGVAFVGTGLLSWLAAGVGWMIPVLVAISVGWDQRPLRAEERTRLPVDDLLSDLESNPVRSVR